MLSILIRNILSNWLGMIISILLGFFLTPFVIHRLGDKSYSFWIFLQSLMSYMFLLDLGVRFSLSLHLTRVYTVGDYEEAHRIINTGLLTCTFVSLAIIIESSACIS